ncbi:hypothetical protein Bca4012_026528 [Brassica carinata]|uniref:Uncharacterized protein n=1 Tax=Brassica carinata TaxID=52824 RepID=A0A8X7VI12_BRACI|nr:hypothetical protein Bca52824_023560 [Brassica carinata]
MVNTKAEQNQRSSRGGSARSLRRRVKLDRNQKNCARLLVSFGPILYQELLGREIDKSFQNLVLIPVRTRVTNRSLRCSLYDDLFFQERAIFRQVNVKRVNTNLRMDFHNNGSNEWLRENVRLSLSLAPIEATINEASSLPESKQELLFRLEDPLGPVEGSAPPPTAAHIMGSNRGKA